MTESPLQLRDVDEYEAFVSGEFPNYLGRFTNLSFIGLFDAKATKGSVVLSNATVRPVFDDDVSNVVERARR